MVGFGEAVGLFYKNYVNFEGRSSRAEYWWPALMQLIIYTGLIIAFIVAIWMDETQSTENTEVVVFGLLGAGGLFALVNFLPSIAIKVRRFHDLDQSGWLVLVFWAVNIFVPVAEVARMIWFALPGTSGTNQYGLDPYMYDGDIFG